MKKLKLLKVAFIAIVLNVALFMNSAFSQTIPTILIDGVAAMANNISNSPLWLDAGKTLAVGNKVNLISVLQYNIAPAQGGGNSLQFETIVIVTTQQTVPTGKAWKIESVALDPTASPIMQGIQGTTGSTGATGADGAIGATGANGAVTSITANSPLSSTGGTSPVISITSPLPITNGGTAGTASPTAGGVAYGTGTAYGITSAGTSGQVLNSNGTAAPTWITINGGNNTGANITQFTTTKSTSTTWVTCYTTCRNANDGGFTDWRMPTMDEEWWAIKSGILTPPDGWMAANYWTTEMGHSTGSALMIKETTMSQPDGDASTGVGGCRCVR